MQLEPLADPGKYIDNILHYNILKITYYIASYILRRILKKIFKVSKTHQASFKVRISKILVTFHLIPYWYLLFEMI